MAQRTHSSKPEPESESNENNTLGLPKTQRVPALKRDFGGLPIQVRSEKGWQTNLVRAEKQSPVQGMPPSREATGTIKNEPLQPHERAVLKRVANDAKKKASR